MKLTGTFFAISWSLCSLGNVQAANPVKPILKGQPNFRDLGGYKTIDGRTVKQGLIFRSGELPRLTDQDVHKLHSLGIKSVVNFLTEREIKAHGTDRLPKGTRVLALPISDGGGDQGGLVGVILEARQKADFSKVPVALNPQLHRLLVNEGKQEYAKLIRHIANAQSRPVVFHCSHGVHRTGTAAAILLTVLGVPWETVRKDYLLSNDYRKHEIDKRLKQLQSQAAKNRGIPPKDVDMTNFNAFYILQPTYIDAVRDEVRKEYGSMARYIRDGLKLEDQVVDQLRQALLE